MMNPTALRFHQTWLAGKRTIEIGDFSIETPISSGFLVATFDDTGGTAPIIDSSRSCRPCPSTLAAPSVEILAIDCIRSGARDPQDG